MQYETLFSLKNKTNVNNFTIKQNRRLFLLDGRYAIIVKKQHISIFYHIFLDGQRLFYQLKGHVHTSRSAWCTVLSIKLQTLSTKACASHCPPHHLQVHCLAENSCHASQGSYCVLWIPYISVKKYFVVSLIFDSIFRSISNRNPLNSAHTVDDLLITLCFFLIQ